MSAHLYPDRESRAWALAMLLVLAGCSGTVAPIPTDAPRQMPPPGPMAATPAKPAAPQIVTIPAPPRPVIERRNLPGNALSGQRQRVGQLLTIGPDCAPTGTVTSRVSEQPAHGRVFTQPGMGFSYYPQGSPLFVCNTRRVPVTEVYYQSEPGFTGSDSFTLDLVAPGGAYYQNHYEIDIH